VHTVDRAHHVIDDVLLAESLHVGVEDSIGLDVLGQLERERALVVEVREMVFGGGGWKCIYALK
jgi:hypothetical protein